MFPKKPIAVEKREASCCPALALAAAIAEFWSTIPVSKNRQNVRVVIPSKVDNSKREESLVGLTRDSAKSTTPTVPSTSAPMRPVKLFPSSLHERVRSSTAVVLTLALLLASIPSTPTLVVVLLSAVTVALGSVLVIVLILTLVLVGVEVTLVLVFAVALILVLTMVLVLVVVAVVVIGSGESAITPLAQHRSKLKGRRDFGLQVYSETACLRKSISSDVCDGIVDSEGVLCIC
jgi:hypothetical protein